MAEADKPPPGDALRPWRRRTAALFWLVVGVFCTAATVQVAVQLFFPVPPQGPPPGCEPGLAALSASLDRGWEVARGRDDEPERALDRFRAEVAPTWRDLPGIRRACLEDGPRSARLDALERLRYALESRVRVEGGSLAALRRRALGAPPGATTEAATTEAAPSEAAQSGATARPAEHPSDLRPSD